MQSNPIIISSRYCGPSESGNGGYVCGRVAKHLPKHLASCVVVRLKAPPPLETELRIEASETEARLLHESTVIAEARGTELDLIPPPAPSFAQAEAAANRYAGFTRHAFPRCFVCGPQRIAGDGLRIFPGSLGSDRPMVASPWIPDATLVNDAGSIGTEFLWAALDCPGAFAVMPVPETGKAAVLGELCARIDGDVVPGERCVVIGWLLHMEGRKRYAGTALFSAAGHVVAVARATWLEVPASAFGG